MANILIILTIFLFPTIILAQTIQVEKKSIVIAVGGTENQIDKLPYAIALNKGYFQQEGLEVKSIAFGSGTKGLQALIGGGADATQGAYEHTIRMQLKGINLTCLGTFSRYPGNVLMIPKSKAGIIKNISDLKGKKIGVSAPGAASNNFVAQLLQREGVNWKDASYVGVGIGSSAVASIRNTSELDALVNLDPAVTELTRNGDAIILADSRNEKGTKAAFNGDYLAGCVYVKTEFLKQNPGVAQAITNALVRSMQWLKTASIDEIIASLPNDYYKSNESIYREALSKNMSAFTWDGIITAQAAQNVLDSLATMEPEFKNIKINLKITYDNSLTELALKKYGSK
jgi:NitT/TauT family transport system substrate-binding protein